jgi:hypothetical protein
MIFVTRLDKPCDKQLNLAFSRAVYYDQVFGMPVSSSVLVRAAYVRKAVICSTAQQKPSQTMKPLEKRLSPSPPTISHLLYFHSQLPAPSNIHSPRLRQ